MEDKLKGKFVIAGTGSRELILDVEKRRKVRDYLVDLLTQAKAKHGENLVVISGMAEGFDEALARAAIQAGVPFIAAIPNPGYLDYYWGKKSLLKVNRLKSANEVLSHALGVINVCPTLYGVTHNFMGGANFDRNEWMADHANIVWVYNPTTKGTAQCYKYCKEKKIKTFIINVDKETTMPKINPPAPTMRKRTCQWTGKELSDKHDVFCEINKENETVIWHLHSDGTECKVTQTNTKKEGK